MDREDSEQNTVSLARSAPNLQAAPAARSSLSLSLADMIRRRGADKMQEAPAAHSTQPATVQLLTHRRG